MKNFKELGYLPDGELKDIFELSDKLGRKLNLFIQYTEELDVK
jgi:hypothetical protein